MPASASSSASASASARASAGASRPTSSAASPAAKAPVGKGEKTSRAPRDADVIEGYKIVTVSDYSGQYEVLAARTGSKISHKRTGLSYLTHPNSDDVTVLNEREKTFCIVPRTNWKPPFITGSLVRGDQFIDLRVEKVEQTSEYGLKAERRSLKTTQTFHSAAVRSDRLTVTNAQVVDTNALSGDKANWKVISALCGIPALGGYPLSVSYINRKNKEHSDLKTELLKVQKLPAAVFDVPSTFKKVADLKHVYANSGDTDSFKDILEGF